MPACFGAVISHSRPLKRRLQLRNWWGGRRKEGGCSDHEREWDVGSGGYVSRSCLARNDSVIPIGPSLTKLLTAIGSLVRALQATASRRAAYGNDAQCP